MTESGTAIDQWHERFAASGDMATEQLNDDEKKAIDEFQKLEREMRSEYKGPLDREAVDRIIEEAYDRVPGAREALDRWVKLTFFHFDAGRDE